MRHFDQLSDAVRSSLFSVPPAEFDAASPLGILGQALGATLYMPGTRNDLSSAIRRQAGGGVRSMVIDLEDAVDDAEVEAAVAGTRKALTELSQEPATALLFVRVRTPEHISEVVDGLGGAISALTGFVVPKFSAASGARFLGEISAASHRTGTRLLVMPVLETPEVLYRESRDEALSAIRALLAEYQDMVLAVRLGTTDLCGLYGIRRDSDLTIYEVGVVAELIAEVVNHLGRSDGTGYPITGPVWEYFAGHERIFRPQLRMTPFANRRAGPLRQRLLVNDVDALLREIILDRANGLTGKTVIHPSHVAIVHSLSVVAHEEFGDAVDIASSSTSGAKASGYRNKMNEIRPHKRWAEKVIARAEVFGVARKGISHIDILKAMSER